MAADTPGSVVADDLWPLPTYQDALHPLRRRTFVRERARRYATPRCPAIASDTHAFADLVITLAPDTVAVTVLLGAWVTNRLETEAGMLTRAAAEERNQQQRQHHPADRDNQAEPPVVANRYRRGSSRSGSPGGDRVEQRSRPATHTVISTGCTEMPVSAAMVRAIGMTTRTVATFEMNCPSAAVRDEQDDQDHHRMGTMGDVDDRAGDQFGPGGRDCPTTAGSRPTIRMRSARGMARRSSVPRLTHPSLPSPAARLPRRDHGPDASTVTIATRMPMAHRGLRPQRDGLAAHGLGRLDHQQVVLVGPSMAATGPGRAACHRFGSVVRAPRSACAGGPTARRCRRGEHPGRDAPATHSDLGGMTTSAAPDPRLMGLFADPIRRVILLADGFASANARTCGSAPSTTRLSPGFKAWVDDVTGPSRFVPRRYQAGFGDQLAGRGAARRRSSGTVTRQAGSPGGPVVSRVRRWSVRSAGASVGVRRGNSRSPSSAQMPTVAMVQRDADECELEKPKPPAPAVLEASLMMTLTGLPVRVAPALRERRGSTPRDGASPARRAATMVAGSKPPRPR